jgi:very-short-patch-repair endonuclease
LRPVEAEQAATMCPSTEPAWIRLVRTQHGVISRPQLLATGIDQAQLITLCRKGILQRQTTGVYRIAPAPGSVDALLWHAVLATRGVLYSTSAAYLWNMVTVHRGPIRIVIPRSSRVCRQAGVAVLRRDLPASAVGERWLLPVTSRQVSAIDHLVSLPVAQATSFADRALQRGWIKRNDLHERLRRPARGNPVLRQVLASLIEGAEAESERLLHRLLRAHGITGWKANYRVVVADAVLARIDVAFVEQRVAVEIDGFAYHSAHDRFQHDRSRQNLLTTMGWTVLRFTWEDITSRPRYVLATIQRACNRD